MELPDDLVKRLAPWGFDRNLLETFSARARASESNAVKGTLTPPAPEDITPLPAPGTPRHQELSALGRDAIARGKVGAVILAGLP